ncbi:MAG: DUF885 domain-containing protein [Candidatus Limnocylindrales bacterium]
MPQADEFRSFTKDQRPKPETPFEHALHGFLDDVFVAYPTLATDVGYHEVDPLWPDMSGTGRLAQLAMLRRHHAVVQELDEAVLSADEQVDRRILLDVIESFLFDQEVLREPTWDPLSYVRLIGDGFFSLLARDYAPFMHRGMAFLIRMRHMPEVFAAARDNLLGMPNRPVSLLHTETALAQLDGIGELIDEAIRAAYRERERGEDTDLHRDLEREAPAAREAVKEFRDFLEDQVLARARGEGRLGPALFRQKLRHTLSSDLAPEALLERARRDFDVVREEMVRLARELWPSWLADEPEPDVANAGSQLEADNQVVRKVLDAIGAEHRQPEELLDYCQREVARIERFVRRNQMIGLPPEPLRVTWTPTFMRAYGGAFLSPPGPLDKGQPSYFWITPPDEAWPSERTESYLREDNDRMLRLLCIHEGVPGHYLQLSWSNRSPSLTRSVFANGMFAEGWAVYVTQVMMDVGYGGRDPSLMLIHWKFYLRCVTNAILDVLTHTQELTEEGALDLMVRQGFQEEQEARSKWLRARLTSTQLSTYYLGSLELWDLEVEVRRRDAVQAGAGAEIVPEQRIVGGLGDTPGFDLRAYLESVVAHGSPPIRHLREVLLREEVGPPLA